jgi:hypothetical protein
MDGADGFCRLGVARGEGGVSLVVVVMVMVMVVMVMG